jgi:hypothetical protein
MYKVCSILTAFDSDTRHISKTLWWVNYVKCLLIEYRSAVYADPEWIHMSHGLQDGAFILVVISCMCLVSVDSSHDSEDYCIKVYMPIHVFNFVIGIFLTIVWTDQLICMTNHS